MSVSRAGNSSYSPDAHQIAYFDNKSGAWQLWVTDLKTLQVRKLTNFTSGMWSADWCPTSQSILVVADQGGNQKFQFFLVDADTGKLSDLTTDKDVEHDYGGWTADGKSIFYADNSRNPAYFDCYVMDVATGKRERIFQKDATLHPVACSRDGNLFAVEETHSEVDSDIEVIDRRTSSVQLITKHSGHAKFSAVGFSPDDKDIYYRTNQYSEFMQVVAQELETGKVHAVASENHEIDLAMLDPTGTKLAISSNIDGYERPSVLNLADGSKVALPPIPLGIAWPQKFSPDGERLSISLNLPVHDDEIYDLDLQTRRATRASFSPQGGIDPKSLVMPKIIRYRSFDGLQISAICYVPKGASARHPAPVILSIHGGPEDQEQPYLINYYQFLIARGYAIIPPNVRGSTGYGKTYVDLDNGPKRLNALKDLEYAVRWIRTQRDLDSKKVVCYGPSYGGFATLVLLFRYPDLFAGGIDFYGPTDLKSFLAHTASYRRADRIAEYGDPAKDSAFLDSISPAKHADQITKPLLVIQGKEDPIVPYQESETIVDLLRRKGRYVDYLLLPREGHGLGSQADYVKAFDHVLALLKRCAPTSQP